VHFQHPVLRTRYGETPLDAAARPRACRSFAAHKTQALRTREARPTTPDGHLTGPVHGLETADIDLAGASFVDTQADCNRTAR